MSFSHGVFLSVLPTKVLSQTVLLPVSPYLIEKLEPFGVCQNDLGTPSHTIFHLLLSPVVRP